MDYFDKKFKLDNKKLLVMDGGEVVKEFDMICDLLEKQFGTITSIYGEMTTYTRVFFSPDKRKKLKEDIKKAICDKAAKKFGNKEFDFDALEEFSNEMESEANNFSTYIYNTISDIFKKTLNNEFGLPKTAMEENMFKNIKEAREFTAHLDTLANEIQGLEDVSEEMRTHLAYRIDKLSDLIEESTMSKQANGMGQGAWVHDADEARYMSTMGGTGALKHDADETRYMSQYANDDHMEVLKRTEPATIHGAGPKVMQPSDNYNEKEVADKLRMVVKNVMAKMK